MNTKIAAQIRKWGWNLDFVRSDGATEAPVQFVGCDYRPRNQTATSVRGKDMNEREIDPFRQKLEVQRAELRRSLQRADQDAQSPDAESTLDNADRCVISTSKELLFERSSQRRTQLRLIEGALQRIGEGSFGICVGCSEDIPLRRLEALPWTQFCLQCQEAIEDKVGATLSARISAVFPMGKRVG